MTTSEDGRHIFLRNAYNLVIVIVNSKLLFMILMTKHVSVYRLFLHAAVINIVLYRKCVNLPTEVCKSRTQRSVALVLSVGESCVKMSSFCPKNKRSELPGLYAWLVDLPRLRHAASRTETSPGFEAVTFEISAR